MTEFRLLSHGKQLDSKDYNSLGEMIADSDSMETTTFMTRKRILEKYGDILTEDEQEKLK